MMQQAQALTQQRAGPQWNQRAHAAGVADAHQAYGAVTPGVQGPIASTAQRGSPMPTQPRPAIRPLPQGATPPLPQQMRMAPLGRLVGR
jgi:hypothetical protein